MSAYQKKNNKGSDWSDVKGLHAVLHDLKRSSDPEGWKKDIEAAFDVDVSLKWLGICSMVGHWDTYGLVGNFAEVACRRDH